MKPRFLVISILALFAILTNVTCSKPQPDIPPDTSVPLPSLNADEVPVREKGKPVRSTIIGRILSTQFLLSAPELRVLGANGTNTRILSDPENYYRIESNELNEDATIIKDDGPLKDVNFALSYPILVQKDRVHYFYKVVVPDDKNYVLSKEASYFENGVTIAGIGVKTEKDSWISEDAPYSGNVEMTLLWANNKTKYLVDFQPGDMRGVNKNGQPVYIHPYLMTGLKTVTRNMYIKGLVSPGKKISLHVPIPEQVQGVAENRATTWMYDKDQGLWKELDIAEKNGTYYDFSIPQVGVYAVASATPMVYLHARLVNKEGDLLTHTQATITPQDNTSWPVSVYTDNKGEFATYVPAAHAFTLRARDVCTGNSDTVLIGPLMMNTWLTQTMPLERGPMTVLEGEVIDCDNLPLKSGNILLRFRDKEISAPIKNGKYSLSFSYCEPAPVSYLFYDSASRIINSEEKEITLQPGALNKMPVDTVCKARIKYVKGTVTFTVDGATYTLNGDEDRIYILQQDNAWPGLPATYMYATSTKINKVFGVSFNNFSAGTYNIYTMIAGTPSHSGYIMAWGYYAPGKVIVNNLSFKDAVLKGSFSSPISRESSEEGFRNPVPIEGSFDLKGQ